MLFCCETEPSQSQPPHLAGSQGRTGGGGRWQDSPKLRTLCWDAQTRGDHARGRPRRDSASPSGARVSGNPKEHKLAPHRTPLPMSTHLCQPWNTKRLLLHHLSYKYEGKNFSPSTTPTLGPGSTATAVWPNEQPLSNYRDGDDGLIKTKK